MITLYCATKNRGKLREFALASKVYGQGAVEIRELPGLDAIATAPETAFTYAENARQKAVYYQEYSRLDGVFADDSGLEVEALGGRPGVHSARYAGEDATDAENRRKLLDEMKDRTDRRARFVCVISLVDASGQSREFHGVAEGELLMSERGTEGFGYDPLFYYPPLNKTFAELSEDEKLAVSHRGRALQSLFAALRSAADVDAQAGEK